MTKKKKNGINSMLVKIYNTLLMFYLSFLNFWIEYQLTNELSHSVTFVHLESSLTVVEHDDTNIASVVSVNNSS
jgi:hypothetical protein